VQPQRKSPSSPGVEERRAGNFPTYHFRLFASGAADAVEESAETLFAAGSNAAVVDFDFFFNFTANHPGAFHSFGGGDALGYPADAGHRDAVYFHAGVFLFAGVRNHAADANIDGVLGVVGFAHLDHLGARNHFNAHLVAGDFFGFGHDVGDPNLLHFGGAATIITPLGAMILDRLTKGGDFDAFVLAAIDILANGFGDGLADELGLVIGLFFTNGFVVTFADDPLFHHFFAAVFGDGSDPGHGGVFALVAGVFLVFVFGVVGGDVLGVGLGNPFLDANRAGGGGLAFYGSLGLGRALSLGSLAIFFGGGGNAVDQNKRNTKDQRLGLEKELEHKTILQRKYQGELATQW